MRQETPRLSKHSPKADGRPDPIRGTSTEDSEPETVEDFSEDGQPEPAAGPSEERAEDMSAADVYSMYHERIRKLARGRQEDVSKALTNVLRHSAERAGLSISADGCVSAAALMKTKRFQRERISMDDMVAVVTFNDKARLELAYK